jgi:Raf kinase inhibitor-like YbhB/YbcL family protein
MKMLRVLLFASFMLGAVSVAPRPFRGVSIIVSSNAFVASSSIPAAYTCDGANRSPELEWSWVPDTTKSIAIVVDDYTADRAQSVHWLVWNIDPNTHMLPAGSAGGGVEGVNDFERLGYSGPCPPSGETHVYLFRLFALDTILRLDPPTTAEDLQQAMDWHLVGGGTLVGWYARAQVAWRDQILR